MNYRIVRATKTDNKHIYHNNNNIKAKQKSFQQRIKTIFNLPQYIVK